MAVPYPGARDAMPALRRPRLVVGEVTTTGSSANATRPTLTRLGTWFANEVIAARAAPSLLGATSVATIE